KCLIKSIELFNLFKFGCLKLQPMTEAANDDVTLIKQVVRKYIDNVLLPLAEEGVLDAEIAKDAIELYVTEVKRVDVPEIVNITQTNEYALLHPFTSVTFDHLEKEWKSVEHYFQAARFFGTDDTFAENIRNSGSAAMAHRRGANAGPKQIARKDWNKKKKVELRAGYQAMLKASPEALQLLKSTGNGKLVLLHKTDTFYGVLESGRGENEVGKVLMELRDTL
ncbi:MAG: NADAR family protein, partial [Candidatus Roizmanbacteria bacterium]